MSWQAVPVLVMAGITLYVGCFYLLVWLRRRQEVGYLQFFGLCVSVAAYDAFSALLYNSRHLEAGIWFQRGQFSTVGCIALCMILFITRQLRLQISAWPRLLFGACAALVILSWIDSPLFLHLGASAPKAVRFGSLTVRYLEAQTGPALIFFFLLFLVGILTFYAYSWRAFRRHGGARSALLVAALTVFFLATINDILVSAQMLKSVYVLEYSFLAVILAVDFLLQREYLLLVEREKEHARELRESLARIKTLRGLLPICVSCKKIRNDNDYWQSVEVYVAEHSEADFSHGLCPDCARRLYPDYYCEEEPTAR